MISIKTKEEIQIMREGGEILAEILGKLSKAVRPGIPTSAIEKLADELILFYGVKSAFLNFGGYPSSICVSLNDEIVHCVPSERIIKEGDVVSLDFGIVHNGFNLDSAVTVIAGKVKDKKTEKLLSVTREALDKGIKEAKIGKHIGDISYAIQSFVEENGFSVIRELVGHGIGKGLHEEPQIPNFGRKGEGPELVQGLVLAIEPMVSAGSWQTVLSEDKFAYKTKDGSLAAHFEHTIAVTKGGPLVLTYSNAKPLLKV